MAVRLVESQSKKGIPIKEMFPTQVGRVVMWNGKEKHENIGAIVQVDNNHVIVWGGLVHERGGFDELDRVEILPNGVYQFEIINNK